MDRPDVVVLDYGSGNVRSAVRALEHVGARVELSGDPEVAEAAQGLVIPGVGAFAACMESLRAVAGPRVIGRRLAGGRPILGICVGMQVMFERGVEHGVDTAGCGQWPGIVDRLSAPVLPHMGWNTVDVPGDSELFAGVVGERFYFVHSYAARSWGLRSDLGPIAAGEVAWATHGEPFVAAVDNGALAVTQFHPEKSGEAGLRLLRNWLDRL
ncbi:MAG: imidazole glycerol phosphate synthase subunit HisH [Candidatus Nanopelagicales bacterium]|nr:imidazole glycerol phosphate synthase subunit HisH [Candidatus Nanopelagicales bacterium]